MAARKARLRRPQSRRHAMPAARCTCCATRRAGGRLGSDHAHLGQSAKVRMCVAFLQEQLTGGPFRLRDAANG